MSLNKVQLIGNIGKDPDIQTTKSGKKFARFSVATSERWKNKSSGEYDEKTTWHNVVVWSEPTANYLENNAAKGLKVYVEGHLETRKWEKDGVDRYSTEVIVNGYGEKVELLTYLDKDSKGQQSSSKDKYPSNNQDFGQGDDLDDEIPF